MPREPINNPPKDFDVVRTIDPHLPGKVGNAGRNPGKPGDFSGSTPGTKA